MNIKVGGYPLNKYLSRRDTEENIAADAKKLIILFSKIFLSIPSLKFFFYTQNKVDRESFSTSLLFRPIGQMVMFSVLKVAKEHRKFVKALKYFSKDDFNLDNIHWKKIFFDEELGVLKSDKSLQKYAIILILKKLDLPIVITKKEKIVFDNFNINPIDI